MQLAPYRFIFCHAVGALVLTAGIAWITPLAFSGFRDDQSMSGFWLWLSDTVSWWGMGLVMLLATALVATGQTGLKARVTKGLSLIASLCAVIGVVAAANEFGIKRAVTVHRDRTEAIFKRLQSERFRTGRDRMTGTFEVSAWEAFNAVQGYVQHDATRKGSPSDFARIIQASNDAAVKKAETLALATLSA